MAQVVEYLLSKYEALNLNPVPPKLAGNGSPPRAGIFIYFCSLLYLQRLAKFLEHMALNKYLMNYFKSPLIHLLSNCSLNTHCVCQRVRSCVSAGVTAQVPEDIAQ
jgi:hypothetical protein